MCSQSVIRMASIIFIKKRQNYYFAFCVSMGYAVGTAIKSSHASCVHGLSTNARRRRSKPSADICSPGLSFLSPDSGVAGLATPVCACRQARARENCGKARREGEPSPCPPRPARLCSSGRSAVQGAEGRQQQPKRQKQRRSSIYKPELAVRRPGAPGGSTCRLLLV